MRGAGRGLSAGGVTGVLALNDLDNVEERFNYKEISRMLLFIEQ